MSLSFGNDDTCHFWTPCTVYQVSYYSRVPSTLPRRARSIPTSNPSRTLFGGQSLPWQLLVTAIWGTTAVPHPPSVRKTFQIISLKNSHFQSNLAKQSKQAFNPIFSNKIQLCNMIVFVFVSFSFCFCFYLAENLNSFHLSYIFKHIFNDFLDTFFHPSPQRSSFSGTNNCISKSDKQKILQVKQILQPTKNLKNHHRVKTIGFVYSTSISSWFLFWRFLDLSVFFFFSFSLSNSLTLLHT